ncbi:hypothetical protein QWY22_15020 [Planococcus liqunii]|uniref:PGN_0703 family putative restriction endonuclease n=1 Tax=Planococcus liqunii TaxID=3058394 RepID=UPI0026049742|nr:hypothetical protein [Planococcus sp. N056]WKA50201.1 hypothetical protein QWY22_15020 [Planococcus sp. N056]
MAYKADMKKHLSRYKLNRLGVEEHGEWDGRKYTHILPISHKDLNLLEPYRIDLAEHIEKEQINRQWGFHHLTSSQVVCLNFFYPLIKENQLTALLEVLDMSDEEVKQSEFEYVLAGGDGTNFDFYIELASGKKLFFEIKYTEDGFGKKTSGSNYQEKYDSYYQDGVADKLKPGVDGYERFMDDYQLMRNISYVDATDKNMLIILYPEGNRKIRKEYDAVLANVIEASYHPNIRLLTWETVCTDLMEVLKDSNASGRLLNQYSDFAEKYLPLEGGR